MKRKYYAVVAYFTGDPGFLTCCRVPSKRKASAMFGTLRTKYPGATVATCRHTWDSVTNSTQYGISHAKGGE